MSIVQPICRPIHRPIARSVAAAGVGGFTPLSLYQGGVGGIWDDPSSIASLDQSRTDPVVPVTASGQVVGRIYDLSGNGNTANAGADTRRGVYTVSGNSKWLELDGTDDGYTTTTGGGASTAFFVCIAFRCDTLASSKVLFDNRSGNTGFQLSVNSSLGRIDANAWNGTSVVANATSSGSIVTGTDYIVTFWYDGSVTRVQVNSTTVATSAAVTLSAGPAAVGIGRTIAGASYLDGRIYGLVYTKDSNPSAADRERVKSYLAAKASVTL